MLLPSLHDHDTIFDDMHYLGSLIYGEVAMSFYTHTNCHLPAGGSSVIQALTCLRPLHLSDLHERN